MAHACHAFDCNIATKPEMFMCLKHWRRLAKHLQRNIWAFYRPGQCDDWNISDKYAVAAKEAIKYIAAKEGKIIPEGHVCLALYDYLTDK